jgi:putative ABC transport system substrate-binding protein
MRRREFITLLGGAAAGWPLAGRAQQPTMPVVGYLSSFPADINPKFTQAFRQGLTDAGFFEGRNVTIEYRWDEEGRYDRLPVMAADFVSRGVAALFASPIPAALAAKAATATIPIVFAIGSDPVETGLVVSLNRPGGNITGVTFLSIELGAKRLELLRELVPKVASIGLLVNPKNPNAAPQMKHMQAATTALGLQLNVLSASAQSDFDNAFAMLIQQRIDALVVSADPFFISHREQIVALAERDSIPAIYYAREFAVAGGLISYASSFADSFRQAATYVGRILNGEKPGDLPVLQPTKFELVINLKAAKARFPSNESQQPAEPVDVSSLVETTNPNTSIGAASTSVLDDVTGLRPRSPRHETERSWAFLGKAPVEVNRRVRDNDGAYGRGDTLRPSHRNAERSIRGPRKQPKQKHHKNPRRLPFARRDRNLNRSQRKQRQRQPSRPG